MGLEEWVLHGELEREAPDSGVDVWGSKGELRSTGPECELLEVEGVEQRSRTEGST